MGLSTSPSGESNGKPRHSGEARHDAEFGIDVEQSDGTLLLRLTGEFDWSCIGSVEAALARAGDEGIRQVVFDLRSLDFLDSAGLKTILRANDRAKAEPFELGVVRPRGLANRVFTLTRAGEQLTMVDGTATPPNPG